MVITKFQKQFQDSVNPNTYFWIVEVYILLSEKFNIADIIEEVFNDYSRLLNAILFNISKLAAKQTKIEFFTAEERKKTVFPLSPAIYEIYA